MNFTTEFKFVKFSNTLSSKTILNSCSIDVNKAVYSKLSKVKSLLKSPSQFKFFKSIFSKLLNTFIILD